jgi:hypothetical protein
MFFKFFWKFKKVGIESDPRPLPPVPLFLLGFGNAVDEIINYFLKFWV